MSYRWDIREKENVEKKKKNLRVIDEVNVGIGWERPLLVIVIASERSVGGRVGGSGHFF